MRRLLGFAFATILVLATFAPVAVAAASPGGGAPVVLAQSEGATQPAETGPGPEPKGPDATDNPAAPMNYKKPVIWAGSMIFLALALLGAAGFVAAYLFFIVRPRRSTAAGQH